MAGAFEGLERIIKDRVGKKAIGFGAQIESKKELERYKIFEELLPQDLLKFGLIPELIGRMPITVALKELTKDDLVSILTEPKNAITKQFKASFDIDNVELNFDEDAIAEIAEEAIRQKTGARGLRTIVEKMLMDVMFEIPDLQGRNSFTVTKELVQQKVEDIKSLIKQIADTETPAIEE